MLPSRLLNAALASSCCAGGAAAAAGKRCWKRASNAASWASALQGISARLIVRKIVLYRDKQLTSFPLDSRSTAHDQPVFVVNSVCEQRKHARVKLHNNSKSRIPLPISFERRPPDRPRSRGPPCSGAWSPLRNTKSTWPGKVIVTWNTAKLGSSRTRSDRRSCRPLPKPRCFAVAARSPSAMSRTCSSCSGPPTGPA